MDKFEFDKLCENTFTQFSNEVKRTIKDFPEDISLNKVDVLTDDHLLKLMQSPLPID